MQKLGGLGRRVNKKETYLAMLSNQTLNTSRGILLASFTKPGLLLLPSTNDGLNNYYALNIRLCT